jgi:hypothetical protein
LESRRKLIASRREMNEINAKLLRDKAEKLRRDKEYD